MNTPKPISHHAVQFLSAPPAHSELGRFFSQSSGLPLSQYIERMLNYRPYPGFSAVWAQLLCKERCEGIATLYLPPRNGPFSAPVFVGNFMIAPAYQRRGLGSHLLQELEQYCRIHRYRRLALEFTPQSLDFWIAKGFMGNDQYPKLVFKSI